MAADAPDTEDRTTGEGHAAFAGALPAAAVAFVATVALLDVTLYADRGGLFALCLAAVAPRSMEALATGWSLAPSSLAAVAALSAVILARRFGRNGVAPGAGPSGQAPHSAIGSGSERRAGAAILEVAAVLLLATALLSPLCRLAGVLASANMLQHMLLVAVVPALLAFGGGLAFWGGGRPADGSAFGGRRLAARSSPDEAHPFGSRNGRTSPAIGSVAAAPRPAAAEAAILLALTVLHGASIWLWHVPAVYGAALADAGVNVALHLGAFGLALLFYGRVAATTSVAALAAVFATLVHTGLLGALLTFAPEPLYSAHLADGAGFGIAPLADQQAAGLLMWIGGGLFYATVLFVLTRRFLARHLPAGLDIEARRAA